jgi:hypothetical protein
LRTCLFVLAIGGRLPALDGESELWLRCTTAP